MHASKNLFWPSAKICTAVVQNTSVPNSNILCSTPSVCLASFYPARRHHELMLPSLPPPMACEVRQCPCWHLCNQRLNGRRTIDLHLHPLSSSLLSYGRITYVYPRTWPCSRWDEEIPSKFWNVLVSQPNVRTCPIPSVKPNASLMMNTICIITGCKCWFPLISHLWVSPKKTSPRSRRIRIWSIGHLYCTWVSDPVDGLHHPLLYFLLAFTFTLWFVVNHIMVSFICMGRTKWLRKVQHRLLVTDREGLIFMYFSCVVLYFLHKQFGWWWSRKVFSYDLAVAVD